jgi:hypothetical protein
MIIENYSFGKIVIDSKEYTQDVILSEEGITSWQREESHMVYIKDIKEIIKKKPDLIIIGNGYSGIMEVLEETIKFIKNNNIKLIIQKTTEAVKTFNESKEKNKVALLHLTC